MGIAFLVHVVKPIHHLMEICPANFLGELASLGNEIKELTSANVFKNDGKTGESGFILFLVCGILTDINETDQIFMLEDLHNAQFVLEGSKVGGFFLVTLNCIQVPIIILSQFHSE